MTNVKRPDLLDSGRTAKSQSSLHRYAYPGILLLWCALVLIRFFQAHPLDLAHMWRLLGNFSVPTPSSDLTKLAAAARYIALACLLALVGILSGRFLLKLIGLGGKDYRSGGRWETVQNLLLALGLGWGLPVKEVLVQRVHRPGHAVRVDEHGVSPVGRGLLYTDRAPSV